jgi:hypothetical protein
MFMMVALLTGLFFAFTLVIDPYGVSPLKIKREYINDIKPARIDIDRLIKPLEVWKYQPKTILLGSSRIQQGFDPAVLDGSRFAPAYNASIPASTMELNVSHLARYISLDPNLKTVVVELFFYQFLKSNTSAFVDRRPIESAEIFYSAATLFVSWDTLKASVQTLFHNLVNHAPVYEIKPAGYFYYPPGHNSKGQFDGFAAGIWKLQDTRPDMQLDPAAFQALHEIAEICRSKNIELVLLLAPNHAYDDFYINAVGAWGGAEEWLRRVSREASVFSFSQPNALVYEPVASHMTYWNDPYHFSLEMGRRIQLALTGQKSDAPANFMVELGPSSIAAHIEERREKIRLWANSENDFVARFYEERSKWLFSKVDHKK